jgi:Fur family transcriptional regulator, ferric uptake regulator
VRARGDWAGHALEALQGAGYRSGGARRRVVDLLARQPCALTALEIDRRLERVGRASVYRALEQLEELRLIQRVDLGAEAAGYERLEPDGAHHHHLVCGRCGNVVPFADPGIERRILAVAESSGFELSAHEVVLRGTCPSCAPRNRRDAAGGG